MIPVSVFMTYDVASCAVRQPLHLRFMRFSPGGQLLRRRVSSSGRKVNKIYYSCCYKIELEI
jgi:hypothetical protein